MSTMKIVALVGVCLLLGGCVPVTSIKSVAALIISLAAAVGAWFGILREKHACVISKKAEELDKAVTIHEEKYQKV